MCICYQNCKIKSTPTGVLVLAMAKVSAIADYREYRIRTYDPLVPNQVLYQAELIPVETVPTGFEPALFRVTGEHVNPYTTEPNVGYASLNAVI